jgi:serine/threonine protein kinase
LELGQLLNNRYRIDALLGQGGFGAVYKAWDLSLEHACAVKENVETAELTRRQFTREATVLASLSHTNLPRVTDHFYIPTQGQYLVMDFVEGQDLGQLIRAEGPLTTERALDIIGQVVDALAYLHSRKPPVLHRDIKPANIKITPDGRAVLVDFGLVKMYSPQLETTVGARAITPGYSPPEQYGQGTTDPRSDIYSLAATLYTLLTGQKPQESVQRYGTDDLKLPHELNPHVPPEVSAIVGRAMALSPSQRYQSVQDLRTALYPAATPLTMTYAAPVAAPRRSRTVWWLIGGAAAVLMCLALAGAATVGGVLALPFLRGTSTPAPTAVPTEIATKAAINTPLPLVTNTPEEPTSGPPAEILFEDDFSNPSGGWSIASGTNSVGKYDNGQYELQILVEKLLIWTTSASGDLSNIRVEVTAASAGVANDPAMGVVCGYQDDDHFYFLGITPDGYYAIDKFNADHGKILTSSTDEWERSARIGLYDTSYQLQADCGSDGTLVLYVNGLEVARASDTDYPSGTVGLMAQTFKVAPAEVRFDDLVVTALP